MPNIVVTRQDAKSNILFYKFWALVFGILTLISFFFQDAFFIYHTAGLFLALVYWYYNNKSLRFGGNIVSKSVMSYDSLKGSLLLSKATFVGWIVLSAMIFGMIITSGVGILIDTFFFFVFVLVILYKRMRLLSISLKK